MLHVEELLNTIRFFHGGKQYGDPFDAVATIVICGDLAYICAMKGDISRSDWLDLQTELKRRGVVDLLTFRRGERCWYDVETGRTQRGVRFPVEPSVNVRSSAAAELPG